MRSRTLYLHIGLPKTGSTFLQQQVFPELSHLNVMSMPLDRYFEADQGERLFEAIFKRSDTIWKHDADMLLDQLLGTGWQQDERDILLSDEAIGRQASRQGLFAAHLAGMREALRERGVETLKILCFVRRQDHWLMSHYVQMSDRRANAGQADLEALTRRICDPRFERYTFGALLDYASIRAAAAAVVAAEDVLFLPMEWLRTNAGQVDRHLTTFLGMRNGSLTLDDFDQKNVRQSGDGRWKLRASSRRNRLFGKVSRRNEYVELSPGISRSILDTYRSPNEAFEAQTGVDLSPLGYFSTS